MIVCALLPLLTLRAALGQQQRLQDPVAVAPHDGGPARIGEVSPPAFALGVRPGMQLGEAVDICPTLGLVPADPARAATIHERLLTGLESIGAGVESDRPGEAFFQATEIDLLHDGLEGVLVAARGSLGPDPSLAAAPTRLAALATAREIGPGEVATLPPEQLTAFLAELPITILSGRLGLATGPERALLGSMSKLNLNRLGDLTGLSADQVADRFGPTGSLARRLALGEEGPIRPRRAPQPIGASIELPEDSGGVNLAAGLAMLCDRVAMRLERSGLTARSLIFEAALIEGGSWSRQISPRRPTASSQMLRTLLSPVPEQLPRPAGKLRLRVAAASSAAPEQLEADPRPEETRRIRLDDAASQVRAAVGETGLLRVLESEPDSRLPERRMFLAPYLSE